MCTPGRASSRSRPEEELASLHRLPVRRLWGVGPATLARLDRIGVATVGDLAALDPHAVIGALGRAHGQHLVDLANGHDDRAVEPERDVKSIGHERRSPTTSTTAPTSAASWTRLADAVAGHLHAAGTGARTLTLKVRDGTFGTITRSTTVGGAVDTADAIVRALTPLLDQIELAAGVRLLGVSASKFAAPAEQLGFDDLVGGPRHGGAACRWSDASRAIDDVRERFGAAAIGPRAASERAGRLAAGARRASRRAAVGPGPRARRAGTGPGRSHPLHALRIAQNMDDEG